MKVKKIIRDLVVINKLQTLTYLLVLATQVAVSQIQVIPIGREASPEKKSKQGRVKELPPMVLPFWDDFSFSNASPFPHDTLWEHGQSVWVNYGMGIHPPTLGVATFDGLDSLGNPYDINDILAKGIADRMVSRALSLDLVPAASRSSVFLSFFYQFRGNGEPPDPGDELQVLFKNDAGNWISVWTLDNDGTLDPNGFTQVLIPVTGDQFFHADFQFKIQNFARLSGPFDTWNIDYVYLNSGRSATDTSYPDRSITLPLTQLFGNYFAMPIDHFIENPDSNMTAPLLSVHNLEFIPGNTDQSDVQPLNYDSEDSVVIYRNETKLAFTHVLDLATSIGSPLQPLEFRSLPITTLPVSSDISVIDSAAQIKIKLWINSGDNIVASMANPFGDYDPVKYAPIDFRHNDTTTIEFTLANYYAYDDGTAEFGAALNQPGAQLAYLFEMRTNKPDTIRSLDLHFPSIGQDVNQSIEIFILKDLSGDPSSFLHRETVTVQRNTQNKFWNLILNRFVGVQNKFYLGWKQSTASVLPIGLDKNTNSGDKIFFNLNGAWEQNTLVTGSLMIRPVFGKGEGIITGLPIDEIEPIRFYPNPNHGSFLVVGKTEYIQLYDITGKPISFLTEKTEEGSHLDMGSVSSGIYILKISSEGRVSTHRVKVE